MSDPVFLLPGEMHWSNDPCRITTLLGSCVAVCLYDAKRGRGGMNHYMLPTAAQGGGMVGGKCGDQAIASLIKLAGLAGSSSADLTASVFGGGAVVGHLGSLAKLGGFDIGTRNIEIARTALAAAGIPIKRAEIGGTTGRRIEMDTATGQVQARLMGDAASQERANKAQELRTRKIRVLIVDDSTTVRRVLAKAVSASEDMEVLGEAENPYEARERILEQDPDVICLDIIMPRLDGLSFLRKLMQYKPIPVVVVSTIAKRGSEMRAKVEEAGAVGVVDKEELRLYQGLDTVQRELLPLLRQAAHTVVGKRGGDA